MIPSIKGYIILEMIDHTPEKAARGQGEGSRDNGNGKVVQ